MRSTMPSVLTVQTSSVLEVKVTSRPLSAVAKSVTLSSASETSSGWSKVMAWSILLTSNETVACSAAL